MIKVTKVNHIAKMLYQQKNKIKLLNSLTFIIIK
jgi:hypothetical protein